MLSKILHGMEKPKTYVVKCYGLDKGRDRKIVIADQMYASILLYVGGFEHTAKNY